MISFNCSRFDVDLDKFTKSNMEYINNLRDEENKTFFYYIGLYKIFSCLTGDERIKQFNGRDLLIRFTKYSINLICEYDNDPFTENRSNIYNDSFDILYRMIKDRIKNNTTRILIESAVKKFKDRRITIPGYSWDDAFKYLDCDKSLEEKYSLFAKTILLSEDYFNVERIYELRLRLSNSKHLKDLSILFDSETIDKDISSIFFSDYKYFQKIYTYDIYSCYKNNNDIFNEYFYEYILFFIYGRFLLNMFLIIYQSRVQFSFKDKNANEKINHYDIEQDIDIFLNKLSSKMDLFLFDIALKYMDEDEIYIFLFKKIYEDVLFHVHNNFSFEKITKHHRFMAGIKHAIDSNKYNDLIVEMRDIALKEWKNGNAISHISMIEFLKKTKKFAEVLVKRGVESNLKKVLIQTCRENNFPYIQGEHMHKRVKREKSASKNSEKPENKKRTKKMA